MTKLYLIVKPQLSNDITSFQLSKKIYDAGPVMFDKVFKLVFDGEQKLDQTKLVSLLMTKSGFDSCGLFDFITLVRGKS